jgi:hypothetical protein
MTDRVIALTEVERAAIVIALVQIQSQLDRAGEALAAVYISHVLDCLDPETHIDRPDLRSQS